MEKLKILFITSWYPIQDSTVAGVFVREHAKAVSLFDEVKVLHFTRSQNNLHGLWGIEEEKDFELTEGIPTYRAWRRNSPLPKTSFLLSLAGIFSSFHQLVLQGFLPDIIHAHVFIAGFPAVLLGKFHNIPVVITEHWTGFPRKILSKLDIRIAKFTFSQADRVLPVSRSLQQALEEYKVRAVFSIVPNVVDMKLFHPAHIMDDVLTKRILFVGNLEQTHVKGFPVLLHALAEINKERKDWCLDVIGGGTALYEYQQLVSNLNLSQKVQFHGFLHKVEVARMMNQSDFLVLPSLWENLPCVLIEAMASGLPVVSTTTGGIPEIVDPETGILVPPGDGRALRDALVRMFDHASDYDRSLIAAKASRYSLEHVGEMLHSIYLECRKP